MGAMEHWERVYATKRPEDVSWYRAHLDVSLRLIADANSDAAARIIDVGGGESTLADDLVASGYRDVTVLDLSSTAIRVAKQRLATDATTAGSRGRRDRCPALAVSEHTNRDARRSASPGQGGPGCRPAAEEPPRRNVRRRHSTMRPPSLSRERWHRDGYGDRRRDG